MVMRSRAFGILGLALVLAVASAYLAHRWLLAAAGAGQTTVAAGAPQVANTRIVVATVPLRQGGKLRREHVRLADWPIDSVPQGAFTAIDDIFDTDSDRADRSERVVLRSLAKNEPVLRAKVSGFGGRAILSTLIAPGLRAATIRVNDVNGVAGFVLPGDRVDVLLTRDLDGGDRRRELATDVLLQNMRVLGIDQDASEDRQKPSIARAVTLELSQADAQKLTLAQRLGTLSLALRPGAGVDVVAPPTVTARDLPLGAPPRPAAAAPAAPMPAPERVMKSVADKAPAVSTVRIVRGLEAANYEVAIERPVAAELPPEPVARAVATAPRPRARPPFPGDRLEAATDSGAGPAVPIMPNGAPPRAAGGDG